MIFESLKHHILKFKINHIAFSVTNVEKSVDFYKKVLQLKEIENTASNSKTRWLQFEDGRQFHLIPRNFKVITNKAVHLALTTNDFQSFIENLIKLNVNYEDWIGSKKKDYVRKDGVLQIYFQDPDGYWIEVNNAS
jgi:catechol 2,3-dioxygenase-like lactoylglutathione lyase family enzyme